MQQIDLLVKRLDLLAPLTTEEIDKYLNSNLFRVVSYNKNTIIHLEGDKCSKLEIILSGEVVVERLDESGGLLVISDFFKGDILGGSLIFSGSPYYPMSVSAKKPSSILEIEKDLLFNLMCEKPDFLKNFLEFVSDNTKKLSTKIKNNFSRSIRERVLDFLKHEARLQNTNIIKLPMSKKALADRMGIQRTSLSRELTKMKVDGLIDYDANTITIL